ncbi:MAG: hypothetical protein GEV03_28580 [Streptosporangiales bacterium]|nr:hypothetical protein [Streptosporangiales bacterium]
MRMADAVRAVVETLPEAVCVSALGTATSALRLVSDDAPHLYFGGAMGCALPGALGLAEARPESQIVAILGDGDLLMGATALWSFAAYRPPNLRVVVLADGYYSITGGQQLAVTLNAASVADALGGIGTGRAESAGELAKALSEIGPPCLIEAVIDERTWPGPSPFVDPMTVRARLASRLFDEDHGMG